jgi:hypothetical protein
LSVTATTLGPYFVVSSEVFTLLSSRLNRNQGMMHYRHILP